MFENVTKKRVAAYFLTPQIMPRFHDLVFSGFGYVALFMAQIYRMAGLLPPGHPYLNGVNAGRFGVRHVIAEAASHLQWKKTHIDQIAIFIVLLLAMVLLFLQLLALGLSFFMDTAHAALPTLFTDFFITKKPEDDLAFILLDRVFGLPDFFGSCVNDGYCDYAGSFAQGQTDGFVPFHAALHAMMSYYSMGLLVIATIILLYFVFAVVAETAETGTPFGKRFKHVWAPLRLVAAFGLLIPIGGSGLNSAQYITLYAAKWGSGFATNGWIYFLNEAGITNGGDDTVSGPKESLVSVPQPPNVNSLVEFFTLVSTCGYVNNFLGVITNAAGDRLQVDAYLVNGTDASGGSALLADKTYGQALEFYKGGDVLIRFGLKNDDIYGEYAGGVFPLCGEIRLNTVALDESIYMGDGEDCQPDESAAACLQRQYYQIIKEDFWSEQFSADTVVGSYSSSIYAWGCAFAISYSGYKDGSSGAVTDEQANIKRMIDTYCPLDWDNKRGLPSNEQLQEIVDEYRSDLQDFIEKSVKHQRLDDKWAQTLEALGWAGAGIWYNKIAELNGSVINAAYNQPYISQYPEVMQKVFNARKKSDVDLTADWYTRVVSGAQVIKMEDEDQKDLMRALFEAKKVWDNVKTQSSGGGVFIETIKALFGLEGLYNITASVQDENGMEIQIHPLAQLTGIGRSLVESAINNLAFAGAAYFGGGVAAILFEGSSGGSASAFAMGAGKFFIMVASMGLTIGFVLFYVVPFFPFLFFYFAVGKWVKSIFEAMVGVPLWALAHLRIDGEGLPGDAAKGGYLLIFEIFLRPILILFGLLAGMIIFIAQVRVLHEIWETVTTNVAGYNPDTATATDPTTVAYYRGVVDQFFYTVIYAIVVYMLATASFKLVDLIPNQILRWMGESVSTFGDQAAENPEMMRNAFMASSSIMGQLGQGMEQAGKGTADAGKAVKTSLTK